jgi:hypothetical protein
MNTLTETHMCATTVIKTLIYNASYKYDKSRKLTTYNIYRKGGKENVEHLTQIYYKFALQKNRYVLNVNNMITFLVTIYNIIELDVYTRNK